MPQSIDEFRTALTALAEKVQRVREHVRNEEATKVSLILPFIAILGYDDRDPTEVAAEHASDFSDKYRNRVDYAILRNMLPIIAIECKTLGGTKKDDRGQLKSYFNASKTVKLGVLTDGVVYEFFVDSQEPNIMDDEPFLEIDLEKIARAQATDTSVEALFDLTKSRFDPETVSENARRNITHRAFFEYLSGQFREPGVEFTRFLLKENNIKHVRSHAIDGYRAIAKAAFDDVFTNNVLQRLDIQKGSLKAARQEPVAAAPSEPSSAASEKSVVTTAGELKAFDDVRRRLAFLASGRTDLFEATDRVRYRDYQGKMVVFLDQERKGRLLEIHEGRDGSIRFVVSDGGDAGAVADLASVDERLRALFERRVAEV